MRLKTTRTMALGLSLLSLVHLGWAKERQDDKPDRPRLVVGMVVDQMCWDYLYRYNARFSERGGFRRLLREGFNCHNARINYLPAVTAIGHATVYTGSVPNIHGIAGNYFYDRGQAMYCTEDPSVHSIGTAPDKSGAMSPRNMLVTTIGDELRIATNFTSKVLGIALKDRGAILPAGHSATAAYWFDDKSGGFISSSYYMDRLPRWVESFNNKKLPEKYLRDGWKSMYPLRTYKNSTEDMTDYEVTWGDEKPTLPQDTKNLMKKHGVQVIRATPMGNDLTLDMARAAIEGEKLGMHRDSTDFLAISLSSTDYIGHRYATFSVEIEDTYLRLDKALGDFFNYLDSKYGKDGYLFFITSDHAAAHNLQFKHDRKLPGRKWRSDLAKERIDAITQQVSGTSEKLLINISNFSVYFDEKKIDALGLDRDKLYNAVIRDLEAQDGVAYAIRADQVKSRTLPDEISMRVLNGYNRHRSGAIFIVLHPGWDIGRGDNPVKGTNHSVWSPYDTHIPLIFMGKNIPSAHLYREVFMTDIAPTLAYLLKTQLPSGCIGKPITELFED